MNTNSVKIFFSNCYGIENIFNPNNFLFTTFPFKLVNEYQSFPTCLQDSRIFLVEVFSEDVCYLKSWMNMSCNH